MASNQHALTIRNREYVRSMRNNMAQYLIYLSTLSRFHRYEAEDIPSFILEAPQSFSAVATKSIWQRLGYEVEEHAKGVSLVRNGNMVMSYDISEVHATGTESRPVESWKYDEIRHRGFLDAVVPGRATTQEKIIALAQHVADHSRARQQDKKLVAYSIASVVLERMGQSNAIPVQRIASMNLEHQNVNMEEITSIVQAESRTILDAFREIAQKNMDGEAKEPTSNPLLANFEPINAEFPPETMQERSETIPLFDAFGYANSAGRIDGNPSTIEPEVFIDDEEAPIQESKDAVISQEIFEPVVEDAENPESQSAQIETTEEIESRTVDSSQEEYGYYVDYLTGADFPPGYIRYDRDNDGGAYGIITYPEKLPRSVVAAMGLRPAGFYSSKEEELPSFEDEEIQLHGYSMNLRKPLPQSLPAGFVRVDREDANGIFGTVWYAEELTEEQQAAFGLLPVGSRELDLMNAYAYVMEDIPRDSFIDGVLYYDAANHIVYLSREVSDQEMNVLGLSSLKEHNREVVDSTISSQNEETSTEDKSSSIVDEDRDAGSASNSADYEQELSNTLGYENNIDVMESQVVESSTVMNEGVSEPPSESFAPPSMTMEDAMARITGESREKNMFRDNVRAILTLKNLRGREATEEEKNILRKYHSFGGLSMAFDAKRKGWESEYTLLHEILTPSEYIEARATVLNAYYTDPAIVRGIYRGLEELGFSGGRVLEPSMGVGAFLDSMPNDMRTGSNIHGIELDSITGGIAKALHPDANIQIKGFEKADYGGGAFDLTISNVPFGNYKVNDAKYNSYAMPIHDYFAQKMLDETRPGGISVVITSHYTMDKMSEDARRRLFQNGELVRAIRLPDTAFRNAGADVSTDILIFRKRERPIVDAEIPSWVRSVSYDGDPDVRVNSYFLEHPEYVLGDLKKTTNAYGFDIGCKGTMDGIEERIVQAFQGIEPFYVPEENPKEPVDKFVGAIQPLSYQISGNDIIYSENGVDFTTMELKPTEIARVKAAISLRDALNAVIHRQVEGVSDEELHRLQQDLDRAYERYVEKYGRINEDKTLRRLFSNDASYRLMLSIEIYGKQGFESKAPIFTERTVNAHVEPTSAENALDALSISMQEKGMINLGYMSILTDKPQEELLEELYGKEIFFDYDSGMYVPSDEYLSGDIREKIEGMEKRLARIDSRYVDAAKEEIFRSFPSFPKLLEATTDLDRELDKAYEGYRSRYGFLHGYFSDRLDTLWDVASKNESTLLRILVYENPYGEFNRHFKKNPDLQLSTFLQAMLLGRPLTELATDYDMFISTILELVPKEYKRAFKDYIEKEGNIQGEVLEKALLITEFLQKTCKSYDEDREKFRLFREGKVIDFRKQFNDFLMDYETRVKERATFLRTREIDAIALEEENINIALEALKKVLPKELTADDIHVELGTTWIPESDYVDFLHQVMGVEVAVRFSGSVGNGSWKIEGANIAHSNQANNIYGTKEMNGVEIAEALINLRTPKIYRSILVDGKEKRVVDQKATIDVQQKAEEIKAAFQRWVWTDETRKERLVAYYNRHFNNIVPREFNGDRLTFPGMNPAVTLRKHQRDAIARTLYGANNALFGHSVGAGKTYEIAASIMEAKRLGLTKKSVVVVPKHLTEQFGAEFLSLYPNAKILVATAKDFSTENRKAFCSKIATQEWDAVVMSFSQFERIPISKERQEKMLNNEIDELSSQIAEYNSENGKEFTVRQAEHTKKKLEEKLARLSDMEQDSTISFEALGCDRLYVDEAHNYKNRVRRCA